jgi:hypothetical protein
MTSRTTTLDCPYCHGQAKLVTGRTLYPHRPDLAEKQFFLCAPCDAYCGTHPGGRPLGRLADAHLRRARQHVHALFDPLYLKASEAYDGEDNGRLRNVARARAYRWLAAQMGILVDACHVGMFDLQQCREAYRILRDEKPTPVSIRAWAKARKAAAL